MVGKREQKHLVLIASACMLISLLLWWYIPLQTAARIMPTKEGMFYVNVPKNATFSTVFQQVKAMDVQQVWWRWRLWSWLSNSTTRIQAGQYAFYTGTTPVQILTALVRGETVQYAMTVLEGWTFQQMRQLLAQQTLLSHDTEALSEQQILAQIGADAYASAEGLFFPDTYYYRAGQSDLSIFKQAYTLMQDYLQQAWQQRAQGLSVKTAYEALILASVIEKETARAQDRGLISSVFHNRLAVGMRLQADPTVIYALGPRFDGDLRRKDLRYPSPYNTYMNGGLPPTPIALPGRAALQAAVNPERSDFLYFVAKRDGGSIFSTNLRQHNRAVYQVLGD